MHNILSSPQLQKNTAWRQKQFQAGNIIVKEGDQGGSFFFIEQGEVRVYGRVHLGKNRHIQPGIGDLKEGTIFGESCLHTRLPRIATVSAIKEVHLIEIDAESLKSYLDENPIQGYSFYKKLFEISIDRLNSSNHNVESLMAWGLKAHEIDQHL